MSDGTTTTVCLICLAEWERVDLISPVALERPPTGAIALCEYCGGVATFTGNGYETRWPTDDELVAALRDPIVRQVRAGVRRRRIEEQRP